ncbi:MAG: ATP-binding protein [Acidobacteriota bacterium]|nr:ATP-binding protein [Acidobacteriota bacterium]
MTALALGGLAWNAVTSTERIEETKLRDLRIESLRGRIVYLDEVLTMSARLAAATGDSQWEARYRRFDPELDRAIEEAVALAPEAGAADVVARTQAANTALVRMENNAFELIRQKRLEEARATLFSKEYDRLKAVYAGGMRALDAALQQSIRRARERELRRVRFVLIISLAILPVLFGSWFLALRTMNRFKSTLARNQERMATQAAELAQLNASLDRKVAERTGELERSREKLLLSEAQFRQAQKMEAVGQLAGGVAHDFNNLLTTIIGYGELVLGQLPSGHKAREEMLEVLKAGERAAVLTRQLLAFSRKQLLAPVVLDLNKVVSHLQKMLERLIGAQIELSTVLEPRVACIRADSGQLEQIIVNLAVNARDAMPGGGRITIETKNVDLTEEYAQEKSYVTPGPHVRLTVSDTGTGMDEQTKARIFEPFFTTKEQGKGTGLGLSMVYGIVKQSGGSIEVESEPGQGTSVEIYFPVTTEKPVEPSRVRLSDSRRGTETILLVEDEDGVRSFVRRALQAEGYSVLEAPNAEIAMKVAEAHAGAIGLLLTDIIMPGLSGPELAVALAETRPEMKVLFISGYTGDAVLNTSGLDSNAAFLQKPFNPAALGLKVHELLNDTEREI